MDPGRRMMGGPKGKLGSNESVPTLIDAICFFGEGADTTVVEVFGDDAAVMVPVSLSSLRGCETDARGGDVSSV